MRKAIFFVMVISLLATSCHKSADLTVNWIGNYDVAGSLDTINRVAVTRVNDNTVQMQLQVSDTTGSPFNTYATFTNVVLSSATTGSFNEYGLIAGEHDTYHFVGTATLNNNDLTVNAIYTDTTTLVLKTYYFLGSK